MQRVRLTRDSVAISDDFDAPHEKRIPIPAGASLAQVLEEISRSGYLARIAGGKATWVVESGAPLAVMAQQWSQPEILPAGSALSLMPPQLHFKYLAQEEPSMVVARLSKQGEPNNSFKADALRAPP